HTLTIPPLVRNSVTFSVAKARRLSFSDFSPRRRYVSVKSGFGSTRLSLGNRFASSRRLGLSSRQSRHSLAQWSSRRSLKYSYLSTPSLGSATGPLLAKLDRS